MSESINLKPEEQMQELLELLEEMQAELDLKEKTTGELENQLSESLILIEKLNNENKTENIQALKSDFKQTKDLLRNEKAEASIQIKALQDNLEKAEQDKMYAQKHQKTVEISVEKPILYEKCNSCEKTAVLKLKKRYELGYQRLERKFKRRIAAYDIFFVGFMAYSLFLSILMAIRTKVFFSDFIDFASALLNGISMLKDWIIVAGRSAGQIGRIVSEGMVGNIVYWFIFLAVIVVITAGILTGLGFSIRKIVKVYGEYCWDRISVIVGTGSIVIVIFFGDWIKQVISLNLLLVLLCVQVVYVIVRWYVKGWRATRGYF